MKLFLIPLIILFQTATATPTPTTNWSGIFPPLSSPTPFQTPTPMPTSETNLDDAAALLATADGSEPANISADGEQIFINGLPVLPGLAGSDASTLLGYIKWITSPAAGASFGPFGAILIPFGVLLFIALINLLIFIWEHLIVSIFKFVLWIVNRIITIGTGFI